MGKGRGLSSENSSIESEKVELIGILSQQICSLLVFPFFLLIPFLTFFQMIGNEIKQRKTTNKSSLKNKNSVK